MTGTEAGQGPMQYQSEHDAMRDELAAVVLALERLRDRAEHVRRVADDEVAGLTQRIGELETENGRLRAQLRRNQAESRERRKAASGGDFAAALQAELKRVQDERDRARKELKNARREVRDLLNGRESLASSSPRSRYTTASSMASPRGYTSAPGPTRPARDIPKSPLSAPQASAQPRSRAARVSTVHSEEDDQASAKRSDVDSEHTVEWPADMYDNYSYRDGPDEQQGDLLYEWNLDRLPMVVRDEYSFGPMTKTEMVRKVQIDEETSARIDRVAALEDHRQLRLLIQGDIAFVFSPITLESFTPRKSYMVTWMTPESTATIQQMIWGTSDTHAQTELHTFIDCPSEEETEAWYYVGKLRWSASHLAPQWPKSIKQIKENLTEAVVQRWQSSHLRAKDIGAIIEQGRFEQFEVELGFDSTLETASMKMRKELD